MSMPAESQSEIGKNPAGSKRLFLASLAWALCAVAPAKAAALEPISGPALVLWLDASEIAGQPPRTGPITTWTDKSSYLSARSQLVERAMSGKHHGVKGAPNESLRLIAWVDANCPYLGEEEIRAMPDPPANGGPERVHEWTSGKG